MNSLGKFPLIAGVLTILYFVYAMTPPGDSANDFHYRQFGLLPVLDGGRYKPMDTVGRTSLMIITHRQSWYDEDSEKRSSANKWMLDAMVSILANQQGSNPAMDSKLFRIENDDLIRELELPRRASRRYAYSELDGKMNWLEKQANRIEKTPAKDRSLFDAKVMELAQHIQVYIGIAAHNSPRVIPDVDNQGQWLSFRNAVRDLQVNGGNGQVDVKTAETVDFYRSLLLAYMQGDKKDFNHLLDRHIAKLEQQSPDLMQKIKLEVWFNDFAPFYQCLGLYFLIAVLGALSWMMLDWQQPLRLSAFVMMLIVFAVHTGALCMRMYLQGRPPVTNLYSTAIFIGWGGVLACLIFEVVYRNGIAIVVGAVQGFCTLIIAHILSLSGDTMEMMQAVLDTNFWLATHVTIINLGYAAVFVGGLLGIAYILLGIFTDMLRGEGAANINRMTYAILCAGKILSFVGTVLGGIWADQSWGRFWGWDPKENGALLIVLWVALILHARWGGMVKQRGVAVLSVLGIIVTTWSWFGTNFLGFGLHSYGWREGAMKTLLLCDLGFFAIALLGALVPLEKWRSFAKLPEPAPSSKALVSPARSPAPTAS
jgi:ABC-type transport system involved in cytochrome c biogenesis permease subunit